MNLNQEHSSKILFFWSNLHKIEVMITFLIEMLGLPNFDYVTAAISTRARVVNFVHVIKIATMFIKTYLKQPSMTQTELKVMY